MKAGIKQTENEQEQVYGKMWNGFCLNIEKCFFEVILFQSKKISSVSSKNGTR